MERVPQPIETAPVDSEVGCDEKKGIAETTTGSNLTQTPKSRLDIGIKQLINKLNLLNFQGLNLNIVFRHRTYKRTKTLLARPTPCKDERLTCTWATSIDSSQLLDAFELECLYVPNGQKLFEVKANIKSINDQQITFNLPPVSHEISERRLTRYSCSDVAVFIFQNGATFYGSLVDYSGFQIRINIRTVPPQTFRWIDNEENATIVLIKDQETVYSGECRIIEQRHNHDDDEIIVEPVKRRIRRFEVREFRSVRRKLIPSPDAVFLHPLFSCRVNLKIVDISGSGFAVEEQIDSATLLPGMIISDLSIVFSDGSSLRCMAQVIYSCPVPDSTIAKCGLTILDMGFEEHTRLLALIHQAGDANIYISNKVDMAALWDFFFETGFIYPEKYLFIEANKEKIKATYNKLYNQGSGIASHFIYQEKGRIQAHMALVRFYDKSWLIHHHAAIRSDYKMAGLAVLNQVGQYIHDCNRLNSMNMDYVFCYFRPENKFPAHVFGGAARHIANRQLCSTDSFAYYHYSRTEQTEPEMPKNWHMDPVSDEDLHDLAYCYEKLGGGLMLKALHLESGRVDCHDVKNAYRRAALKRERQVFALKYKERLCAVIMANHADLGLNMSDLTDSITIFVVNQQLLAVDPLMSALNGLADGYEQTQIPVLMYPQKAAAQLELNSEKSYCLWILTPYNSDPYFRYLNRFIKFARH